MSDRITAICAAIKFVEEYLVEPITVADIAAAAGYSLYHFIRTFNQIVQLTPYDYLIRRRLSQAALALLEREQRVVDIALDFQFNNHETFSRAFRRIYGMPPTSWREQDVFDSRLIMPAFDREILEFLNNLDFVPPRLRSMEKTILAGLMTPLTDNSEDIPALWQNLHDALAVSSINFGKPEFWGIRFPSQTPAGRSFYLAGFKIPRFGSASGAFVTKIIPGGRYICFSPRMQPCTSDLIFKILYHIYIPKACLTLGDPLEIEHIGKRQEILLPVRA
jgi:AraC family transcriptional regulator